MWHLPRKEVLSPAWFLLRKLNAHLKPTPANIHETYDRAKHWPRAWGKSSLRRWLDLDILVPVHHRRIMLDNYNPLSTRNVSEIGG
jgi:hypothetical protein